MNNVNYYKMSITSVLEELKTSKDGLSNKEVLERQKSGKNLLPKGKKNSVLKIVYLELKDPIVIVLLIAALLSFVANEIIDALAIIFIILIDLIVGTIEEYKANKSAEALQDLIKVTVNVIRNGKELQVDSSELVVGDIFLLEAGNKISADARIIESKNLTVNESTLTGESINSIKNNDVITKKSTITDISNMVYAGTSVITGRATAVVTSIGISTEIGKIAIEVNNTEEEKSPLTIRMNKFSKQISFLILCVSIVIAVILKLKGYDGIEIFLAVIALSVSAMPEGLPLALTMALTIGSNKMLKKNVIVKKLNAVESLGSCTVIASDKTGTLTVNEQTAKKIILPDNSVFEITGSGYNDEGNIIPIGKAKAKELQTLIKSTIINNAAIFERVKGKWHGVGDSIDIAFKALGEKYKTDISKMTKIDDIPYESENKYSAVFYEENKKNYCTVKGSIEVILNFCDSMIINNKKVKLDKHNLLKQNDILASEGYRVIAVAQSEISDKYNKEKLSKLSFIGLVAFIDPIRKNVVHSINQCRKSGIKVVMITGDHPLTAFSIAKELKIAEYYNDVANSDDLDREYAKTEEEFDNYVRNKTVFTRVTPIQKLQIVESYKRQGEFIAVTGDGVNDAPAIKSANIGIAMGTGTDVAKETASMIIVDDNFNSIVNGIKEGRVAYSNIRKICYLLLSCGISEVLFFLLSIICNMPMPLVAIQLLWINLVTDGLQDLALSFEKSEVNVMNEKPRNTRESLFDKYLISEILISGIFIGLLVFALWIYLIDVIKMDTFTARGYILVLMVFIQNIHVFNCRSEKISTFEIPVLKNPFILFSILSAIVLQIIMMEVPILSKFLQVQGMPIDHLILMFIFAIPILIVMELYKMIRFYRKNK